MKKILFAVIAFTSVSAYAQVTLKTEKGKAGMFPAFTEFAPGREPAFTKGKIYVSGATQSSASDNGILVNFDKDFKGLQHFRYQQKQNGFPVEGAIYLLHVSKGKIASQNGKWIEKFPAELASKPGISKEAALKAAMADFGARKYKWQLQDEEEFIKKETNNPQATFFPAANLVYYSGEEDVTPEKLRLAYKLDVYAAEPLSRKIYFVDAANGSVLGKRELIHNTNSAGTAITGYSGTQPITTDSYNGSYRLRETGRGNGIQTFNLRKSTNYNTAADFTDADNTWNNVNANLDQYATDAHWGAEKTYDYYNAKFSRNSIDNNGFAIKSYVHYSTSYFNAFWDGSRMTYGDGDASDGNKPLTALDVCGHEITHGLTSFTANLTYSGESGAMNEGFSDVFGTAIEFYARPSNADWLIGGDFYTIRSMSNPNQYQQPDTYQGTYWYTGSSDNGGVHTNSGVLNYWFYLLSAGGSGTNDKGTAFSVSGIGIDKAAAIAYRTLTTYLVPSSKYADARLYSIQSATDLYGAGSNEVAQTTNAWVAVGVGASAPPPSCTDNYESNETRTAAKSIPVNTDLAAKIATSSDKDWFVFTTTSSSPNIKINLSNLPGDYDIRLYNSAGTQLKISQNGGTTAESIIYNRTTAGTYYIQVYGYSGANSASCYLLRVNTSGTLFINGNANEGLITGKEITESNKEISVYPNPAKDVINISFQSDLSTTRYVSVIDIAGRIVFRQVLGIQKGANAIKLRLPKLAKGTYFLKADETMLKTIVISQ